MSLIAEHPQAHTPAGATRPPLVVPSGSKARTRKPLTGWVVATTALLAFLAVWWFVANLGLWSPVFVPSPAAVWAKFIESVTIHEGHIGYGGHYLWEHLWASLRRILIGSAIATVIGVPLGLAIGLIPVLRQALGPAITFLRQLPPLAYFSLMIIWFGIDESPKIILLTVAAMPPIIVASVVGVLVSLVQALTQIQEQTLAFVPKIVAVLAAVLLFGPWILNTLVDFTYNLLNNLHNYIG